MRHTLEYHIVFVINSKMRCPTKKNCHTEQILDCYKNALTLIFCCAIYIYQETVLIEKNADFFITLLILRN